ncbi:MAG: PD-(D/E)XK nuclease family protein [Phycisphaerales bacterium]|nr:PD-(D/E)XK nuclease family protein [Phycisphaerales bacterium]
MQTYSHSKLEMFERCPRQFYYRYRKRISVERGANIEAALGSAVHQALETLYAEQSFARAWTVKELLRSFDESFKEQLADGVTITAKGKTKADYQRLGREMLRKYYSRHSPFEQTTTIALEKKLAIKLGVNGRYSLKGVIDRVAKRKDDTYEIHDYKTSNHLPSQAELEADRQLALYQIGVQRQWPNVKAVELIWHYVRFDVELRSMRTEKQLRELEAQTIRQIEDIESRTGEEDFPPCESRLCDWCGFQELCPVRCHQARTSTLPRNRFLKDSGVKLINRHARLTAQIDELNEQIEALRTERHEVNEALLAYARREGLEVIVGSTHEGRISDKTTIHLPTKSGECERYEDLENKLRRGRHWPEVSKMDVFMLQRIWSGKAEDPGRIRTILKPFVSETQETSIYIRQR